MATPDPGHLGDRLSALLDGELTPADVVAARGHLAGCRTCAAELEAADSARSLLRSLPPVEPPAAWLERLDLPGPLARVVPLHRRSAVLSLAGSVAASLLVLALGAGGFPSPFEPKVDDAVEDHASTVAALDLGGAALRGGDAPPTTTPPRAVEDLPAPYRAPLELDGGYRLMQVYERPDGVHLLYERGRHALSVFEVNGSIDWDAVDGEPFEEDGVSFWQGFHRETGGYVVVLAHGDLSAVLVGDEGAEEVLDAARSLPEPRSLSLLQQVRQACADALDSLSPVG